MVHIFMPLTRGPRSKYQWLVTIAYVNKVKVCFRYHRFMAYFQDKHFFRLLQIRQG